MSPPIQLYTPYFPFTLIAKVAFKNWNREFVLYRVIDA